jgi:hypothetical protein
MSAHVPLFGVLVIGREGPSGLGPSSDRHAAPAAGHAARAAEYGDPARHPDPGGPGIAMTPGANGANGRGKR